LPLLPAPVSPAGVYASLRAAGKKADLSLVVADEPAVAAGCFTKNVMCAAPVLYCKDVLERKKKIKAVSQLDRISNPPSDGTNRSHKTPDVCLSSSITPQNRRAIADNQDHETVPWHTCFAR
jgi:hypothetical protein